MTKKEKNTFLIKMTVLANQMLYEMDLARVDTEGINIYTEEVMVMSFSKGQEPIEINPKTGMVL